VADLTSGRGAQIPVTYARPNLHILFGNEANDDFDAIKVAEIVRNVSGALTISRTYVPPCLHMGASPYLMAGLRELLTSLMARRRALLENTRESANTALEFRTSDITHFLQLSTVNAIVAVVQQMLDTPQLSPWQAHILLVQLTGQLLTFSTTVDPTELPKYAHADLATTFGGLFDTLKELMVVALLKRTTTVSLKMYPNGVLVGDLDDSVVHCPTYVLCASTAHLEIPREKIALELPKLSKIAAKSDIRNVVQTASNGVPLSVMHRPPPEIPIRENAIYFSLQTQHDTWKAVRNDRNVAIFIPPPYSPTSVEYELVAVLAADTR
jgi:type VI secretion system protein ImpJ